MYAKFSDIAKELKEQLIDSKLFKDVRIAAITDYQQILKMVPNITKTPAAVIAIGDGGYDKDFTYRENAIGIIIIDKLAGGQASEAAAIGIWDVLDSLIALFDSSDSDDSGDSSEQSDSSDSSEQSESGAWHQAQSWRPLPLGSDCAGYVVQLNSRDFPGEDSPDQI